RMAVPRVMKACDGGDLDACELVAFFYRHGVEGVVGQDQDRADAVYRRLCSANRTGACDTLADRARAAQMELDLRREACDRGSARACRSLAWRALRGDGVPGGAVAAVAYFQLACRQGLAGACADLAWLYARGEKLPKDAARATELDQRA